MIGTHRLALRRWRPEDAEPFARLNADPEVMRHVGRGVPLGRRESDALVARFEREWAERGFSVWALHDEAGLCGMCGMTVPAFLPDVLPAVEIGWRLARDRWGRGYATEAAAATLAWGWRTLELEEVLAIVDPANARSLRVAEKLAMTARPDRVLPGTTRRVRVLGVRRPALG